LSRVHPHLSCFFCTPTPPPYFYTLSLHDALPISLTWRTVLVYRPEHNFPPDLVRQPGSPGQPAHQEPPYRGVATGLARRAGCKRDRKSTRLNSSHVAISYAVFCLKKKTEQTQHTR